MQQLRRQADFPSAAFIGTRFMAPAVAWHLPLAFHYGFKSQLYSTVSFDTIICLLAVHVPEGYFYGGFWEWERRNCV